ncbi:4124_t:CDS:1, partial [Dentiscutata heterogama]
MKQKYKVEENQQNIQSTQNLSSRINPNKQKEVNRSNDNLEPQVSTKRHLKDISNEYTTNVNR